MTPILLFWLSLSASALEPPWQDLSFTIARDFGTSSDTVTLCRVRVVNHGSHTWPGRRIRFEAVALEGEAVMERASGRFGLSLGPGETLETLIGFSGRYERFGVRPLVKVSDRPQEPRRGRRSGSAKRRGRHAS
jgi:hypothetical protein